MSNENKRQCLTPGAQYCTDIYRRAVNFQVLLPDDAPEITEDQAKRLEDALHDAAERVLGWVTPGTEVIPATDNALAMPLPETD